jgi:6-phosphogluconolactonase
VPRDVDIVVAERPADDVAERLAAAARTGGHIVLTGGSTPRAAYELAAGLETDWSAVELWWGDERCVPADDEDSNYRLARETLIAGAGIPDDRVHRMRGELGPEEGARAYAAELGEHLDLDDDGLPILDVVHLGLGPDGHTASLFPHHESLEVSGWATIAEHHSPKPPPERISLSLGCLNAARRRVLHTVGEGKRQAVERVLAEPDPATPASLLARRGLQLIVDDAAHPQQ